MKKLVPENSTAAPCNQPTVAKGYDRAHSTERAQSMKTIIALILTCQCLFVTFALAEEQSQKLPCDWECLDPSFAVLSWKGAPDWALQSASPESQAKTLAIAERMTASICDILGRKIGAAVRVGPELYVTALHIVDNTIAFGFCSDAKHTNNEFKVLAVSKADDLAVVHSVEGEQATSAIANLSDSGAREYDKVIITGVSAGKVSSRMGSVASTVAKTEVYTKQVEDVGIFDRLKTALRINGEHILYMKNSIKIGSAKIRPGDSGGGVFNEKGELLGIIYARDIKYNGYAVKVNQLRALLADKSLGTNAISGFNVARVAGCVDFIAPTVNMFTAGTVTSSCKVQATSDSVKAIDSSN